MVRNATIGILALLLLSGLAACSRDAGQPATPAPEPAAAAAETPATPAPPEPPPETAAERAVRVHRDAFVLDAHADTLMRVVDDGWDLGERHAEGHVDFPRMVEGGVGGQVFAVWVDPGDYKGRFWQRAVTMMDALDRQLEKHADLAGFARDAADARRLASEGKLAAFLGLEGGYALEGRLSRLAELRKRGVRYMTLTWWGPNELADGSGEPPKWHGLSDLGREAVAEMERLGITVDVSHVSDETFDDVLAMAKRPVIASHSGARAVAGHHRNLSDDMLRALARNGGVVGIDFVAGFVDASWGAAADALRAKLKPELDRIERKHCKDPGRGRKERWAFWGERAGAELPAVPLEAVVDHIAHAAKVAGVDHVGLGSDFDGFTIGPAGLEDCAALPRITERLLARGFSDEDVAKILGGNFLRVFGEAAPP